MVIKAQSGIPLSRWAESVFGAYAPSRYALRSWVLKGQIQPPPKWVRGKWRVDPAATYQERLTTE